MRFLLITTLFTIYENKYYVFSINNSSLYIKTVYYIKQKKFDTFTASNLINFNGARGRTRTDMSFLDGF